MMRAYDWHPFGERFAVYRNFQPILDRHGQSSESHCIAVIKTQKEATHLCSSLQLEWNARELGRLPMLSEFPPCRP